MIRALNYGVFAPKTVFTEFRESKTALLPRGKVRAFANESLEKK
jgi:hypothetical protein